MNSREESTENKTKWSLAMQETRHALSVKNV